MAWSPLGGGSLMTSGSDLTQRMDAQARAAGVDRAAIAVAFLLRHPARILPVLGTNSLDRIAKIADALKVEMSREDMVPPLRGSPGSGSRMTASVGSKETVFTPEPQNSRLLRDAFGRFATGVTIITARRPERRRRGDDREQLRLACRWTRRWCCGRRPGRRAGSRSSRRPSISRSTCWPPTRRRWPGPWPRIPAGLNRAPLATNEEGVPVVEHSLARFDCARDAVHEGGDHAIVVGRVLRASLRDGEPLAFFAGKVGRIVRDEVGDK